MKSTISMSFLLFILFSFSSISAKTIFSTGADITLDLSGYDGRDGHRGANCESGEDGKNGYNGENATIYFLNPEHLKNIELDMSGGLGGLAGQRGSSYNCDNPGRISRGREGYDGQFGYLYLVKNDKLLSKQVTSQKLLLTSTHKKKLMFFSHAWKKMIGAKSLLNSNSKIRNEYSIFDKTIYTEITVNLSDTVLEMELENISLMVKYDIKYQKKAKVSLYRDNKKLNVLIDYEFIENKKSKMINIKRIFYKKDIFDTRLVGASNSGLETSLSIKDSLFADDTFKNSFSFTLYKYHPFIDYYVIVGSVSSKHLDVTQQNDIMIVNIGRASVFKGQFTPGSKYKVLVSTQKRIGDNGLNFGFKTIFDIAK